MGGRVDIDGIGYFLYINKFDVLFKSLINPFALCFVR